MKIAMHEHERDNVFVSGMNNVFSPQFFTIKLIYNKMYPLDYFWYRYYHSSIKILFDYKTNYDLELFFRGIRA